MYVCIYIIIFPYVGKAKNKFRYRFINLTIKGNIELSEKETKKYPRNLFTIVIV